MKKSNLFIPLSEIVQPTIEYEKFIAELVHNYRTREAAHKCFTVMAALHSLSFPQQSLIKRVCLKGRKNEVYALLNDYVFHIENAIAGHLENIRLEFGRGMRSFNKFSVPIQDKIERKDAELQLFKTLESNYVLLMAHVLFSSILSLDLKIEFENAFIARNHVALKQIVVSVSNQYIESLNLEKNLNCRKQYLQDEKFEEDPFANPHSKPYLDARSQMYNTIKTTPVCTQTMDKLMNKNQHVKINEKRKACKEKQVIMKECYSRRVCANALIHGNVHGNLNKSHKNAEHVLDCTVLDITPLKIPPPPPQPSPSPSPAPLPKTPPPPLKHTPTKRKA